MRLIELKADTWRSAMDCVTALKAAIEAPEWHGSSADAFADTMVFHEEVNGLKSPYRILVTGLDRAAPEAQTAARQIAEVVNNAAKRDKGTDLDVGIVIESPN